MKNKDRQDVVINVSAAMLVLYAGIIRQNLDGLIQYVSDIFPMRKKGIAEFRHITEELFNKGMETHERSLK
jgi:hypothetical protein